VGGPASQPLVFICHRQEGERAGYPASILLYTTGRKVGGQGRQPPMFCSPQAGWGKADQDLEEKRALLASLHSSASHRYEGGWPTWLASTVL
jgi:hypothetical protein